MTNCVQSSPLYFNHIFQWWASVL